MYPLSRCALWETPQAVERLVYRGKSSLFVGAIPASENWPLLGELYQRGASALTAIEKSDATPLERAEMVSSLEKLWRDALLSDCVPLGFDDDRHFVTIAGSRSGKGTSAIIPNLCVYPGSVVCLDPKGENAKLTAVRRREVLGQEVLVLDPLDVADVPESVRARFNVVDLLDRSSPDVIEVAAMIAESLTVAKSDRDAHWDESSIALIKGMLLHLITKFERPSLLTLRRFLTQGDRKGWEAACFACEDKEGDEPDTALKKFLKANPSPTIYLLHKMRDNPAFGGVIAGAAETLLSCGAPERGSILSTARRNTVFLDTLAPRFLETLEGKGRTFSPDILKKAKKGASIYLCLPAERMSTHGRWLRLMVTLLLERAYL